MTRGQSSNAKMSRHQSERPTLAGTVVLVEDDADIGRLVEHHLQKAGFATRWFRTATNVIRETENHRQVLFVLDLMLPGIDSLEPCQCIRKQELLRGLPRTVLTANTGVEDSRRALQSAAHYYIRH